MSDLDNEEIEATKMLNLIDEIKECAKNTTREDIIEVVERLGIEKEKSADELFEELGYNKIYYTLYNGIKQLFYKKATIEITFYNDKTFGVADLGGYYTLDMQELKAINKKCKELRMVSLIIYIIGNIILLIGLYLLGYERGKAETIRKIYEKDIDKVRDLIDKVEKLR